MNYLAIDTASAALKILISTGGAYRYYQSEDARSASERLLPEVKKLLGGDRLEDMDAFACVVGPGSFTGIRIGMASVKAFAYALDKKVIAVNTLQLLAYNNSGTRDTVVCVCDAGNGYRYLAVYDDKCDVIMPPGCLKADELDAFLALIDEPYELFADGLSAARLERAVVPSADSFKKAFQRAVESGSAAHYNEVLPLYIRKPQAERDLEAK